MKKTSNFQVGIFCVAVIMSLCVVGIGTAAWQDALTGAGSVKTGEIDLAFTDVTVDADASIRWNDKKIRIGVDEVYAGDEIVLHYTVTNKGSVPARFRTEAVSSDPALTLSNSFPDDVLEEGESADGTVICKIGEVEEPITCEFDIRLHFRQWNRIP